MRTSLLILIALAASTGVVAGAIAAAAPTAAFTPSTSGLAVSASSGGSTAASGSSSLSSGQSATLRVAEQRDADLSDVKAGFALADDDVALVLGTIAVVVLIALLL